MMPVAYSRRIATQLLRFAIWIAPHDTLDWGRGMLSELNHVQGNWAALIWAAGGAGVLAKHALLSVILPGSHRRTLSSASEGFSQEGPMRKTTLAAIGACIAASLFFFLAPIFRQAFHVSLAQWHNVIHVKSVFDMQGPDPDPVLETLARKAEKNHDAEGLAFVAARTTNQSESAQRCGRCTARRDIAELRGTEGHRELIEQGLARGPSTRSSPQGNSKFDRA